MPSTKLDDPMEVTEWFVPEADDTLDRLGRLSFCLSLLAAVLLCGFGSAALVYLAYLSKGGILP